MLWDSVIGQDAAVRFLRRALESGRLPHMLLFSGPAGVGKRTAARALAAAALCEGARDEACGECGSCRELRAGVHPDLIVPLVEGKQDVRDLTDDDREITFSKTVGPLMARSGLRAARGGRKVVLIPRAERMNETCQNALLKSFEEPRGDTVWILTSEDRSGLLGTVRSRAAQVRFGRVPTGILAKRLAEGSGLPPEDALLLARAAEGSFARAEELRSSDWKAERDYLARAVMPRVGEGGTAGPALARVLVERAAKTDREASGQRRGPDRAASSGQRRGPDRVAGGPALSATEKSRRAGLWVLRSLAGLLRDRMLESRGTREAASWARRLEVVLASEAAIRQNLGVELALTVAAARLARKEGE